MPIQNNRTTGIFWHIFQKLEILTDLKTILDAKRTVITAPPQPANRTICVSTYLTPTADPVVTTALPPQQPKQLKRRLSVCTSTSVAATVKTRSSVSDAKRACTTSVGVASPVVSQLTQNKKSTGIFLQIF